MSVDNKLDEFERSEGFAKVFNDIKPRSIRCGIPPLPHNFMTDPLPSLESFRGDTKNTNPKDLVGQTKANIFLIPPAALIAEAEAFMDGAKKYLPYNWREKGVRSSVYLSAAMRHMMSYQDGEEVASDSLVHHLGHARACLGIILDAIAQGNLVDDRPVKGSASRLLAEVHSKNEKAS